MHPFFGVFGIPAFRLPPDFCNVAASYVSSLMRHAFRDTLVSFFFPRDRAFLCHFLSLSVLLGPNPHLRSTLLIGPPPSFPRGKLFFFVYPLTASWLQFLLLGIALVFARLFSPSDLSELFVGSLLSFSLVVLRAPHQSPDSVVTQRFGAKAITHSTPPPSPISFFLDNPHPLSWPPVELVPVCKIKDSSFVSPEPPFPAHSCPLPSAGTKTTPPHILLMRLFASPYTYHRKLNQFQKFLSIRGPPQQFCSKDRPFRIILTPNNYQPPRPSSWLAVPVPFP